MSPRTHEPITQERLERALTAVAYIVTRHGPQYMPIFDRLEMELEAFRQKQDPMERARRVLERHTVEVGRLNSNMGG